MKIDVKKWAKKNIVLIACTGLIIGVHWGWWKMQQNPHLVDPKDRRDLPIYTMYRDLKAKFTGDELIDTPKDKEMLQD